LKASLPKYDKEKYKEMILDAAETVLGFFGFVYAITDYLIILTITITMKFQSMRAQRRYVLSDTLQIGK
jgi:hypothetical protein